MKKRPLENQNNTDFYSEKMFVSKRLLNYHHLKLTYQKQLISDLENKHKEWAKISSNYP